MPAVFFLAQALVLLGSASAQFREDFDGPLAKDPEGASGWSFFTGEGQAAMDLVQGDGYASIVVDATRDRRNVWWALIKRRVSDQLDLSRLKDPAFALRVEARVRVSDAPRRINLHLNTQTTVDFHTHLMEYDIAEAYAWHTISMTTRDFQAEPGDQVNVQMALMDWGRGRYRLDIDYIQVDVVRAGEAGPDLGDPIPYHPPRPDAGTFAQAAAAVEAATVDAENPDVNFRSWSGRPGGARAEILTVGGSQSVILRWDLSALAGRTAAGPALLELTTCSVERLAEGLPDFGLVRVVEIVAGDPDWERDKVTFASLCRGQEPDRVILPQMIVDGPAADRDGDKTYFIINRAVLQRLIDGRSPGIALRPLGAVHASFYAKQPGGRSAGRLLFNLK